MRGVICIARTDGAGGEEVGRLVADRLGFLYVDAEIVAHAAARGGLDPAVVADAEQRRSLVRRLLETLAETGGSGFSGFALPSVTKDVSEDEIAELIRAAISETVARGRVVIGGHGATQAVEQIPDCLRVFVTASPVTRATRVAENEQVDVARARRRIKDADAGRADYLKRFYGIDDELPTHYDLVVNTDALSLEEAAALITQAAR
jgi:uncharacterized protein